MCGQSETPVGAFNDYMEVKVTPAGFVPSGHLSMAGVSNLREEYHRWYAAA